MEINFFVTCCFDSSESSWLGLQRLWQYVVWYAVTNIHKDFTSSSLKIEAIFQVRFLVWRIVFILNQFSIVKIDAISSCERKPLPDNTVSFQIIPVFKLYI